MYFMTYSIIKETKTLFIQWREVNSFGFFMNRMYDLLCSYYFWSSVIQTVLAVVYWIPLACNWSEITTYPIYQPTLSLSPKQQ